MTSGALPPLLRVYPAIVLALSSDGRIEDSNGQLEAREEELGPPGPGEALVRTIVSGISAGTELLFYRGEAPADLPIDETLPALAGRVSFPLKYGYAAVAVVSAAKGTVEGGADPRRSHATAAPK